MSGDRVQQIIERYDKALAGAENATITRVNAALDSAYKRLESELLKAYSKHSENKSLLPSQRKLLILDEVKQYLSLVNPSQQQQYEAAFQALIQQASEMGIDLSGQLTQAIANETLQTFAAVPLDAVRFQAQESARRLYRWSEEYQQKISGVVEMHLATGSGTRKVARALRTELGITKGRAEAIARTETLSALNQAAQANYKQNDIDCFQSIATADSRTCSVCVARNMQVYEIGKASVPWHIKCRCYSLPWKRGWAELGLTNDKWAESFDQQVRSELADTGKQPNNGLSPFEKMNGLTEPPKAVWKPGQSTTPTAPKLAKSLPKNHVVSINPRYSAQAFDDALDRIQSPGASQRVQQLRQFVNNQGIQVVLYDETTTESSQLKLFKESLAYQKFDEQGHTLQKATVPGSEAGFTGVKYRHITVKVGGQRSTFAVDGEEMQLIMEEVFAVAESIDETLSMWSVGSTARTRSADEFATYLHEMGHQVHYTIGAPLFPEEVAGSLTDYGATNSKEWFAEHFTAWMLDAEGYAKLDPVGAKFIEDSLGQAVEAPRRLK